MVTKLRKTTANLTRLLVIAILVVLGFKDRLLTVAEDGINGLWGGDLAQSLTNSYLLDGAIIVLLILFFTAAQSFLNHTVDWRFVRRWSLRKDDIEDVWIDVVKQLDQIVRCGYVIITYDEGSYVMDREVYDRKAVKQGKSTTTLTRYEKKKLSYSYDYTGEYADGVKTGHGSHDFHGDGGRVWNYDGYFYEDKDPHLFYAEGIRLRKYICRTSLSG